MDLYGWMRDQIDFDCKEDEEHLQSWSTELIHSVCVLHLAADAEFTFVLHSKWIKVCNWIYYLSTKHHTGKKFFSSSRKMFILKAQSMAHKEENIGYKILNYNESEDTTWLVFEQHLYNTEGKDDLILKLNIKTSHFAVKNAIYYNLINLITLSH